MYKFNLYIKFITFSLTNNNKNYIYIRWSCEICMERLTVPLMDKQTLFTTDGGITDKPNIHHMQTAWEQVCVCVCVH